MNKENMARILLTLSLLAVNVPAFADPRELTLDDSIHLALTNSHKIKMADAGKEESAWALEEAKGNKGFSLTYTNTNARLTEPPSYIRSLESVDPYNYFSNKLTLAVPLYTGRKVENAIEAQKLGAKVADLSLSTSKQQIKLDTTVDFYQVLQAGNLLEVAKQSVDTLTNHLHNVERQFDAGVVAKADVLRTKVQVANVQDNLIKAQNGYELAVYKLNYDMGLPLHGQLELKSQLEYVPYSMTMEESIQYALKHRSELEQVEAGVAIAEKQVDIARGDKLPTVSLIGTQTWDDTDYPGTSHDYGWSAVVRATWDVFDSGITDAKIKKAKYAKAKAEEQSKDTAEAINLEVSQAYLSLKEAEKRIETNKVAVEEAVTDFDVAQKRYNNGIGINLDVIDAELALNTAKTNYTKALYDYNASRAKLDKAIGVQVE